MKHQPTEWDKISADHVSDQGLISIIYKELTQQKCKEFNLKMERRTK